MFLAWEGRRELRFLITLGTWLPENSYSRALTEGRFPWGEFLSDVFRTKQMTQVFFLKEFWKLGMCLTWLECPNHCPKAHKHYFVAFFVKITEHILPFVNLRIYQEFHIDRNLCSGINVNGTDPSIPPSCQISVIDYH